MTRQRQQKPDRITQAGRWIGLGGIVVSMVFYILTQVLTGKGEASPLLVGAFLSLWGATSLTGALKELKGGDDK